MCGTLEFGCFYAKQEGVARRLCGYRDSQLGGDKDVQNSTSGVIFYLGSSPMNRFSQKQKLVALSFYEA